MRGIYLWSALGLLGLTAAAMAYVLWWQPHYHPVVRVALSDQTVLTVLDNPWTVAADCQAANAHIVESLVGKCADCRIVQNSCERELAPQWRAVLLGQPTPYYVVMTATQHLVVESPTQARTVCRAIADAVRNSQQKPSRCIEP